MIVDYLNWEKVFGKETHEQKLSDVSVVIMAGGKGSRLKPFTEFLGTKTTDTSWQQTNYLKAYY